MDHPKLTPSQSAVLFVLMAEAGELSTPQLRERGPNLDKPGRTVLLGHGLIESRKGSRGALYHSLTDRGWVWCATELHDGPPERAQPPIRALYAVLGAIGRYLDAEDLRLHEIFGRPDSLASPDVPAPAAAEENPATLIVTAYHALAPRAGAFVSVTALRSRLAQLTRPDFDAAMIALQRTAGISLIPQDDRALLTDEDHAAAVVVGTQPCHLLAIEED